MPSLSHRARCASCALAGATSWTRTTSPSTSATRARLARGTPLHRPHPEYSSAHFYPRSYFLPEAGPSRTRSSHGEIGNSLPNSQRQRRICYALCYILYPVSAAHTSIFRMDSNPTSYPWTIRRACQRMRGPARLRTPSQSDLRNGLDYHGQSTKCTTLNDIY